MPSSRPNTIATVIHLVRQLKPRSILDVGVGFGKWGHLFREYTDIVEAEADPARYERQNWQVKIDGIEGHAAYVTEMHRYLYDQIHVGDACDLIRKLPAYDLIFMGDIIEHFEKEDGRQLLREAFEKCNKAVIVTTPKFETAQSERCGNELERHRSLWSAADFGKFTGAIVKTIDRDTLLAVLARPGGPRLVCKPPMQAKPADAARLRDATEQIARFIPAGERFILVDEEQIRSDLAQPGALPFLEKDGRYWGPPANDEMAIAELERLRQAGAKYLVVIWSCFWWLEHYAAFARYLRDNFRSVVSNERLVILRLD